MRLTLRTLLAYLDDVLEPSQTRELGDKINESGVAEQLIARIRDVMRRRRLSAPALSGPGAGIDSNAVGEYLDGTLSPEKTADVEKVCLESDVHLAEVAACHQILTLVLHEPVEIPPESRARMYALTPDGGESRRQTAEASPAVDAPVLDRPSKVTGVKVLDVPPAEISFKVPEQDLLAVTGQHAPPHSNVPEYLREASGGRRWFYAAVVVVGIFWVLLFLMDSSLFRTAKNPSLPGNGTTLDQGPQVAAVPIGPEKPAGTEENLKDAADKSGMEKIPVEKVPVPAQVKIGKEVDSKGTAIPEKSGAGGGLKMASDAVGAVTAAVPDTPAKTVTVPVDAKSGKTAADNPPSVTVESPSPPLPTAPAPVAVLKPAVVKYTPSADGVVLHYEAKRPGWLVLPRSLLYPDDLLAVPEPCEGTLNVDGSAYTVSLRGGTLARLLPPTTTSGFAMEVQRGRIVIHRDVEDGPAPSMLVKTGGAVWRLELLNPNTLCAIEAVPALTDRFEQDLGDRSLSSVLHVASGVVRMTREGAGAEPTTVGGNTSVPLTRDPFPEMLRAVPRWVGPFNPSEVQRKLISQFARQFAGQEKNGREDTAEVSMTSAADDPRYDKQATECLGLIGAYEPLVAILQRTQHDEARKAAIDGLRIWLPQQEANRKLLKQQLSKHFKPADVLVVYELLWGYNAEDLRNRVKSNMLIDLMENADLPIRELAFQNVSRLTKLNFDYRANSRNPAALQESIRRWRRHMQLPKNNGALLPPLPAP